MIHRTDIEYIVHEDNATNWFGNIVEIKGGVNYFLKNSNHNGLCMFNNTLYDISKYDCIIKPEYHMLIDKIIHYESINTTYMERYFNIETNDKRLENEGSIRCYVSLQKSKNRLKYLNTYDFTDKNTFWKVITARANGMIYLYMNTLICLKKIFN